MYYVVKRGATCVDRTTEVCVHTNRGAFLPEDLGVVWQSGDIMPATFLRLLGGKKPTTKFVVAFGMRGGIYHEVEECDTLSNWLGVTIE